MSTFLILNIRVIPNKIDQMINSLNEIWNHIPRVTRIKKRLFHSSQDYKNDKYLTSIKLFNF